MGPRAFERMLEEMEAEHAGDPCTNNGGSQDLPEEIGVSGLDPDWEEFEEGGGF